MKEAQRLTVWAGLGARAELTPADASARIAPNGQPYDHRFLASTDRLASDMGVILPEAWDLSGYNQRPRWIAMHDIYGYSGPLTQISLGRSVYIALEDGLPSNLIGPSGRGLVNYVRYATTPFAQQVKTLYDEGGLDDVSIRWDPRTSEERAPTSGEVALYGTGVEWICTRAPLMEMSAVLFGADPGAQQLRGEFAPGAMAAFERCRSAGLKLPDLEKALRGQRLMVAVGAVIDSGKPAMIMPDGSVREVAEPEVPPAVAAPVVETPAETPADVLAAAAAEAGRTAVVATRAARALDVSAVADAIEELEGASDQLSAAMAVVGQAQTRVVESIASINNLIAAALEVDSAALAESEAAAATSENSDEPRGEGGEPVDQSQLAQLLAEARVALEQVQTAVVALATARASAPATPVVEEPIAPPVAPQNKTSGFRFNLAALRKRDQK